MRAVGKVAALAVGLSAGLAAATQYTAWLFRWPPAFGAPLMLGGSPLYAPYDFVVWRSRFGGQYPYSWTGGMALVLVGLALGAAIGAVFTENGRTIRRARGWGRLVDARRAGLLKDNGCVVGRMGRRLLMTDDLRPTLVTEGPRSGKAGGREQRPALHHPRLVHPLRPLRAAARRARLGRSAH